MKKLFYFSIFVLFAISLNAQTYNMQTGSFATCSGNFYDSGGAGGDYGNNENDTIVFCSSSGTYISINFTAMDLKNGDNLFIYYGSDASSGTPNITNPGTGLITSSCNCITVIFVSNASTTRPGWEATITCSAAPTLSNDEIISGTIPPLDGTCLIGETNVGATADFNYGCFTSGNTVWYTIDLTAGMNTLDIQLQNASFANVEYLLVFGECPNYSVYPAQSAQCVASGTNVQFTNLTEGIYYLGVSSTTEGTFDFCATESYSDICGDYYCGSGETCNTCPFDCGACPEAIGGPYYHPTTGIQNTYLGMCMVSTCTGSYYDNGGPGVTYSNNINQIYRTFCPSNPLTAVQATINVLEVEYTTAPAGCTDVLYVQNGPTQNSTTIWSGCGSLTAPQIYTTGGAWSPTITSTHPSGCLTFRFSSSAANSGYWEGWDISLSCVPFASGPDGTYNYDCSNAVALCNDISVNSEVWGPGLNSEGCGGCVTSENFTEWYRFEISSSGTVELEIQPLGNSDMDFAIYKSSDCNTLGPPVRCSFAAYSSPGKTGLSTSSGDLSEDVSGDQFVAELDVVAGEAYFIMINEWNKLNPNSYSLDWTLTNGAAFDCTILPVGFLDLIAKPSGENVNISWRTASEVNNDYFNVERSYNGDIFEAIATIDGSGNSNEIKRYTYLDENPGEDVIFYRIKQTDFDGAFSYSKVVSVNMLENMDDLLQIYPNPATDAISIDADASLLYNFYRIYNVAGEVIESGVIDQYHKEINTSEYAEGMYYLTLGGEHKEVFIITRSK
ncbi:MAG: T9SS type A sorting domain-containing protein [Bacteroidales bacterium]|nr:T9SS type A sorting domain-containing protein [Bacteroidales bacterium]